MQLIAKILPFLILLHYCYAADQPIRSLCSTIEEKQIKFLFPVPYTYRFDLQSALDNMSARGSGAVGQGAFGQVRRIRALPGLDFALKSVAYVEESDFAFQSATVEINRLLAANYWAFLPHLLFCVLDPVSNQIHIAIKRLASDLDANSEALAEHVRASNYWQAARFARVAYALALLNRAGFNHRDVKPASVMSSAPAGALFLIDLGTARRLGAERHAIGTPYFMPSDAYLEAGRERSALDTYSLALTMLATMGDQKELFKSIGNVCFMGLMHEVGLPLRCIDTLLDNVKELLLKKHWGKPDVFAAAPGPDTSLPTLLYNTVKFHGQWKRITPLVFLNRLDAVLLHMETNSPSREVYSAMRDIQEAETQAILDEFAEREKLLEFFRKDLADSYSEESSAWKTKEEKFESDYANVYLMQQEKSRKFWDHYLQYKAHRIAKVKVIISARTKSVKAFSLDSLDENTARNKISESRENGKLHLPPIAKRHTSIYEPEVYFDDDFEDVNSREVEPEDSDMQKFSLARLQTPANIETMLECRPKVKIQLLKFSQKISKEELVSEALDNYPSPKSPGLVQLVPLLEHENNFISSPRKSILKSAAVFDQPEFGQPVRAFRLDIPDHIKKGEGKTSRVVSETILQKPKPARLSFRNERLFAKKVATGQKHNSVLLKGFDSPSEENLEHDVEEYKENLPLGQSQGLLLKMLSDNIVEKNLKPVPPKNKNQGGQVVGLKRKMYDGILPPIRNVHSPNPKRDKVAVVEDFVKKNQALKDMFPKINP